jgi:cell wall assembly regulator SMI1
MPELYQNLVGPAPSERIADLEQALGQKLPEALTALLACNDGQREEQPGVLFGLRFLSCRGIEAAWREWAEVRASLAEDASDLCGRSLTPGVHPDYSRAGWIPVFADCGRPDYFGVDLDPAEDGHVGQVINFGRNEDDKYVAARNLEGFLASLLAWCKQHTKGKDAPGWVAEVEGNDCVLFNHFHRLAEKPAPKAKRAKAKAQGKKR